MYKAIALEVEDGIATVTLNRPETLNAINNDLKDDLLSVMNHLSSASEVRAILLRGEGRSFCGGGDIKSMGERSVLESYERLGEINRIVKCIYDMDKPVIAVVHGYAAGAGMSLALACDLIFAATNAVFSLSFAKIGLMPDVGGMYFLPRILGLHKAKELLFRGGQISAEEGKQLGFVNEIHPADILRDEALACARELAEGPSKAFALIKKTLHRSLQVDFATLLELEQYGQTVLQQTVDHKEGIAAFREKRKPHFQGR